MFYEELYAKGSSICRAFGRAKDHFKTDGRVEFQGECEKFIIRKADKCGCLPLGPFQEGTLKNMDKAPTFWVELKGFQPYQIVGRSRDLFETIKRLLDRNSRLCTIWGKPGIGKSSLAKCVVCRLQERKSFSDGILSVDLNPLSTTEKILKEISRQIRNQCILNSKNPHLELENMWQGTK